VGEAAAWVQGQVNAGRQSVNFAASNSLGPAGAFASTFAVEVTARVANGLVEPFRVGESTGAALGRGDSGLALAAAISEDAGRAGGLILMAVPAARAATTTEIVHFTDAAGKAAIEGSGGLRAGTFVTKPSEVQGLTASQIEGRLEIQPGRGAYSFAARVPTKNLATPGNGPTTSGGAWQRQLKVPVPTSGPGSSTQ